MTAKRRPLPGEQSAGPRVPAYTPGPALSDRVPPPTESRLNWQMTLLPLQMLPQPLSRIALWPMTEVRRLFLMPWQWNNDSRPAMGCHGAYAQGGHRSLHGRCELSLNKRGPPHELRSKGYRHTSEPATRHHRTQPLQHRHKRSTAPQGQPCTRTMPKEERRDHEKKKGEVKRRENMQRHEDKPRKNRR